ncbi:hypothetical protein SDC9_50924 [bioreactor metagenome]|uniref:Serine aminopeptidase S33 domain-containing protein n=1 Tax=bioreactor metagenome TaxID=1076179 RepID=A0A644WL88_9ZZZZ
MKTIVLLSVLLAFSGMQSFAEVRMSWVEEVTFSRGDAVYSGTLSMPAREGVYPLVIMVSGMGPQDRDWTFGKKYKMAKIIADSLNQHGIAVLRYDDRGFFNSTGTPETLMSFDELAEDVYSAVTEMRKRTDIGKIGLCGHSLGGILSIIAASKHPDIDFIITLSGSYQNGGDIMMDQASSLKRWRTSAEMTDEEVVENGKCFVRNWISFSKGGEGLDAMKLILADLIRYQIATMKPEIMKKNLETFKDTEDLFQQSYDEVLKYYTSDHQKSYAVYDPVEGFCKVTCPVLALFGENDKHVVVGSNVPRLAAALSRSKVSDFTLKIIPLADHGYSSDEGWKNGEMVPGLTEFLINWINFRK